MPISAVYCSLFAGSCKNPRFSAKSLLVWGLVWGCRGDSALGLPRTGAVRAEGTDTQECTCRCCSYRLKMPKSTREKLHIWHWTSRQPRVVAIVLFSSKYRKSGLKSCARKCVATFSLLCLILDLQIHRPQNS